MNFLDDFKRAMPISDYEQLLGDQSDLHQLHYKRVQINENHQIPKNLKILVITEPWCGDSTAILPVVQKLTEGHQIEIRVVLRDKNLPLIDQFLTRGGRAIPILLVLDDAGNFLTKIGPRPAKVREIFESHRADIEAGRIEKKEVSKKIRMFYSKDRGQTILEDVIQKLNSTLALTTG